MSGLSALLGGLGGVFVVFGFVILVLALFGAPMDGRWIWGNFVLGGLALAAAAAMSVDTLRERVRSGEGRRIGKYGTSAVATTLLTLVILGLVGFLGTRYHWRFDWSEAGVHSLADQSRKVLAGLERDVEVLALFPRPEIPRVQELLDRYTYVSDRFHVEYADPTERPDLLERFGIAPEELGQGGVVRIALGDDSVVLKEVEEQRITNALVKLTRGAERLVYFLEGHNERPVEGEAGEGKEGFSRAAEALRNENYRVETLLLAAQGRVPEDAHAVVVAGPTRPLLPEEHAALQRYLERGGRLLVLVDPRAKTDLEEDLRAWGVELGNNIVVDRQLALFGRATTPFAGGYDETHEITSGLRETTLFHVARSVQPRDDGAAFTELVYTGDSSWAERDLERFFQQGEAELDADDLEGPVSIAVAGTPTLTAEAEDGDEPDEPALPGMEETAAEDLEEADARLVVFGDSDFAANEFLDVYRNRDLFVNSVNWLIGDVEAISIRPARSRASRFQPSSEQFQVIHTLSLLVLPEAIAILGVFTWWTRRQHPGA